MADVNEIVTRFSFTGSTAPLGDYNKTLGESVSMLAGFAAAAGAAVALGMAWANSVLASVDPLIQLSRETGIATGRIQELGFAASVSGSDINAVTSTVSGLSQKIGEAAQKGSDDFNRLGISVRDSFGNVKDADQILSEVGNSFKTLGLSMEEQRSFASALGIDTSLLQLLNKSSSEIATLTSRARDLGTLTEDQANQAADYNDSLTTMKFATSALSQSIAIGFAPALKGVTESFTDMLAENKDLISGGIEALTGALIRLAPVLGGITVAFLAMNAAVIAPYVAIVAILAVVDDLIVAFSGGKSVIGDFFKEFTGVDLSSFIDPIVDLFRVYEKLFNGDFSGAFSSFKDYAGGLLGFGGDVVEGIANGGADGIGQRAIAAPVAASTQGSQVNQDVNINIATADPLRAGQAVGDSLQQQLNEAQQQLGRSQP